MEPYEIINLSVTVTALSFALFSTLQVLVVRRLDRRTKHYFLWYNVCMFLFCGGNLAGQLLRGVPGSLVHWMLCLANYLEFVFSCALAFIGSRYLLSLGDPGRKYKAVRIGFAVPMAVHVVLVSVSQFTGMLYTVDAANQYHRAALYPLALVCPGLLLLGSGALLYYVRKQLSRQEHMAFLIYLAVPAAAILGQAFVAHLNLIMFSTIIAVMVMLLFVLSNQTEEIYRKEQEAEKLKVNLMLSQIQPHFLYNSLGVIQALCRSDPEKAEQAVEKFARFLRHNMWSIESDQPILFHQELNHTQNYLFLQELRFGDDLSIVYDLQCETFSLPTLTLQPLVENAVTHGIRQTESGRGTVTIRTRELEDHYEISVLDDGVGFDPEAIPAAIESAAGSRIGLANIRARLSRVCGGSLQIHSAPGMGTTAVIHIPKQVTIAKL